MISSELLKILCCPENKTPLTLLTPQEIDAINSKIGKKELLTVAGKVVSEPITHALVREDHKMAYRIENDIPILLIQEGIRL